MSDTTKIKTYRWALYILIFLAGIWYGRMQATRKRVVYIGPDPNEYNNAAIGVLLEPAR